MLSSENYHHEIRITVRFADLDAMGHLNHAKYLTFMEQARVLYVREVCGFGGSWENFGMILARVACDYHQPVSFAEVVIILLPL